MGGLDEVKRMAEDAQRWVCRDEGEQEGGEIEHFRLGLGGCFRAILQTQ